MTPAGTKQVRRLRPYRPSGLYKQSEPPPEVQQAMAELRHQLIADKGGPDVVSTAELLLIDLAVAAAVKHQAVSAYLATLPSPIDKRHRRVWQVVKDSTTLSAHLQGLLRDLGLERRAKHVPALGEYLTSSRPNAPSPPPVAPSTEEAGHSEEAAPLSASSEAPASSVDSTHLRERDERENPKKLVKTET